jgi:hypothetical protein
MQATQANCAHIFTAESISQLGSLDLSCTWRADNVLEAKLGSDATITPGSELEVLANSNIRSANSVSQPCTSRFTVQVPETPVQPEITVSGTNVIDVCSSLYSMEVTSNSLRDLTYVWSSSQEAINAQLLGYTGPRAVIDMRLLDTSVSIYVYGIDFLQQASKTIELVPMRRSAAVPQIAFSPPSTTIFADQEALLTALAEFSECKLPEAQLLFEWSQVSNQQHQIPAGQWHVGQE